ncbi:DUF1329 domain-containing protein [Azospirillum sp.]|uniref:DUF1329 domain-containing protein n=1 Tax=Azospirillum sp. TaxID=34012 RepID=UPI002D41E6B9|nr:DUF1329 domain-containing protein [Azospirillum sp.]HYD71113.1 DUF1329 domain-containing protein [Azospirillum sp.]HYH23187.1 DUF1329 domain-containing protein [Azospirillum sp.]
MKNTRYGAVLGALCVLVAGTVQAAVTAQEAEQLKTTLTPFGAEKAGNKDGSIPAWSGGLTAAPGGTPGDRRGDPFAADKPLFTITAENMGKYADRLSDGVQALLKKYPATFKINVYPTRRTAAAPQWVYDNTFKNATSAQLKNDGLTLEGAYGGVPFPIPKNGLEVHWNHLTRWRGQAIEARYKVWTVTDDGRAVLGTEAKTLEQYPYYRKDGHSDSDNGYFYAVQWTTAPAFRAGEAILIRETNDYSKARLIWQYLAGQRRIRRAPNIGFDTPDFVASGISFFDESFGGSGSPERFDYKLLGKKEMFVPYNTNRLFGVSDEEAMGAHHLKPELMRWELHRVWVVEQTLKAGKRHAVPKRIQYYDEDAWGSSLMDGWDAQGQLWRASFMLPFAAPDLPGLVTHCGESFHNLQTGAWIYRCAMGDPDARYAPTSSRPDSFFTPDSVVGETAR